MNEFDRVYACVEEMPHLPGAVGLAPVVEAVQRLVVSPRTGEGQVFVELTVSETGDVQDVRITKGLNATLLCVMAAAPGRSDACARS